ncbi:hypothetical protein llh_10760 [Lactococcus cremoris subsp. cremoris A76]|uniref:Uncharacterized protein n=1 Tax=Lactococcus cremoris subsp. cremoris TIFN6 TaxID=1234876 RepID=T0SG35_LACLC|nr:hypothetical protein llh_10760 [Lactococcus cremoris subsp. cremoris A76]EQC57286.1 hypothetical protein LLT6_11320 [Lactococcus cremoris subsp. cremoris TIFN6]
MLMTKNKNRSILQYFAQAWSAWAFFAFNPYVYQAIFQGTRSQTRQGLSG